MKKTKQKNENPQSEHLFAGFTQAITVSIWLEDSKDAKNLSRTSLRHSQKRAWLQWIERCIGKIDKSSIYAWGRGEIMGKKALSPQEMSKLLCCLARQGKISTLNELWAFLNRGPSIYWLLWTELQQALTALQQRPARNVSFGIEGICKSQPINALANLLLEGKIAFSTELSRLPEFLEPQEEEKKGIKGVSDLSPLHLAKIRKTLSVALFPFYWIKRPNVIAQLSKHLQQALHEQKPLVLYGPGGSGISTLLKQWVYCERAQIWKRLIGDEAPNLPAECAMFAQSFEQMKEIPPFTQVVYWPSDNPAWSNEEWLTQLLDWNNLGGIGLGQIPTTLLNAFPILLVIDDLQPGRPLSDLKRHLGENAVIVAGSHCLEYANRGFVLPRFTKSETFQLIQKISTTKEKGVDQELQTLIFQASEGLPSTIIELASSPADPVALKQYLDNAPPFPTSQPTASTVENLLVQHISHTIALLPETLRSRLEIISRHPYFAGYDPYTCAVWWGTNVQTASLTLDELSQMGFGSLSKDSHTGLLVWHIPQIKLHWIRQAFLSLQSEDSEIPTPSTTSLALEAAEQPHSETQISDNIIQLKDRLLQRVPLVSPLYPWKWYGQKPLWLIKQTLLFFFTKRLFTLDQWRQIPLAHFTTEEFGLKQVTLKKTEEISHRMFIILWTGVILDILQIITTLSYSPSPSLGWGILFLFSFGGLCLVWLPTFLFFFLRDAKPSIIADTLFWIFYQRWQETRKDSTDLWGTPRFS